MDFIRKFVVCLVVFSVACLSLSNEQNASNVDGSGTDEPFVVNNVTRSFVAKVFKQYSSNSTGETITIDGFYHLLKTLKIGQVFDVAGHVEVVEADNHKEDTTSKRVHRRSLSHESEHLHHQHNITVHKQRFHNNCIDKDRLLELHQIKKDKQMTSNDFIKLCPSLVYEVQSSVCWHDVNSVTEIEKGGVTLLVWLYGLVSITIISLSSLLAIGIIPCLGKAVYNKVMSFLVALAVGTLAGDAFLHLIPHAFLKGVHTDDDHGRGHVNPLWKGVVIMSGIYLFFMLESFMVARLSRQREQKEPQIEEGCTSPLPSEPLVDSNNIVNHNHCSPRDCNEATRNTAGLKSSSGDSTMMTDLSQSEGLECTKGEGYVHYTDGSIMIIENKGSWKEPAYLNEELQGTEHCYSASDVGVLVKNPEVFKDDYSETPCNHDTSQLTPQTTSRSDVSVGETLSESEKTTDMDHHHHHHHGNKNITKDTSIATVAWMVIVGDGVHNLSDGLAVGAAFSSSITTGLTTAIAVLCHELPHELGDFAILIQSGISFRQAIAYNMASAIISYIGLVIGIGLGNLDTSHVWVLALTSGLFLYISLVSMLPELKAFQEKGGFAVFLSQNAGILTGIIIMLVIALFEKH